MKVVCPDCKAVNNVLPERVAQATPVCGRCKSRLEPEAPGYPLELAEAEFSGAVLHSTKPVLLDLWGPSCPPCRQLAPVLKELAREYAGRLKVAKLNVERQPGVAGRFGVRGIPTLILFKDGNEVARTAGFQPRPRLERFLAPHLGS